MQHHNVCVCVCVSFNSPTLGANRKTVEEIETPNDASVHQGETDGQGALSVYWLECNYLKTGICDSTQLLSGDNSSEQLGKETKIDS